jgi:hypothetical protein
MFRNTSIDYLSSWIQSTTILKKKLNREHVNPKIYEYAEAKVPSKVFLLELMKISDWKKVREDESSSSESSSEFESSESSSDESDLELELDDDDDDDDDEDELEDELEDEDENRRRSTRQIPQKRERSPPRFNTSGPTWYEIMDDMFEEDEYEENSFVDDDDVDIDLTKKRRIYIK